MCKQLKKPRKSSNHFEAAKVPSLSFFESIQVFLWSARQTPARSLFSLGGQFGINMNFGLESFTAPPLSCSLSSPMFNKLTKTHIYIFIP